MGEVHRFRPGREVIQNIASIMATGTIMYPSKDLDLEESLAQSCTVKSLHLACTELSPMLVSPTVAQATSQDSEVAWHVACLWIKASYHLPRQVQLSRLRTTGLEQDSRAF